MATTYYRDNVVHVSSGGVRVDDVWYPLETLTYIWHRRTGRLRHGGYMLLTRGLGVLVVLGLLAGGGILARRIDFSGEQKTMYIAGGILGVLVIGGIVAFSVEGLLDLLDRAHDHGKGVHEIWVRTSDGETMIYSTTDAPKFGQIYRALQRAVEQAP
ncbi:hypothetical protein Drose_07505 [Dactylosporangium roseum]|uniref:Uncharacterized protein n=1 Tax=Dactylosporangium roseum TaxID=47989 RepID=A0ABY5ZAR9_9ACTN|nr:DUF6232 family protein [Dactylosporangium roseum]UWZ38098.1 hypothetical protein Drose_07505 [Dactylosporangium roseum]